ncbi:MAG: DUF2442 domain-containing protein [Caldilineaceae bacterium]
MNTLVLEQDPIASGVKFTEAYFIVELADGRLLSIPLAWYPRLAHATAQELANWQFLGDGYAIEWPDLDEHIGMEGLLAGRSSGESKASLQKWLADRKRGS